MALEYSLHGEIAPPEQTQSKNTFSCIVGASWIKPARTWRIGRYARTININQQYKKIFNHFI